MAHKRPSQSQADVRAANTRLAQLLDEFSQETDGAQNGGQEKKGCGDGHNDIGDGIGDNDDDDDDDDDLLALMDQAAGG